MPALFCPSVISTTMRDFDLRSRSRFTAALSAEPMAVWLPSIAPISSRLSTRPRKSWSSVGGAAMNASVPKATRPMRSAGRFSMKVASTSLSMVRRFTRSPPSSKSSAAMLPERSTATAMSMPLARSGACPPPTCGRAKPTNSSASANHRRLTRNAPAWLRLSSVMPLTNVRLE